MNARASENYLAISRSSSASKSVEIFCAEIYCGRLFLRAESSLIQSSLLLVTPRIFLFDIKQKNPRGHEYQTTFNRAVVPLFELSFLTKSQKLTSA
jgi:hypothetical protein